MKAGQWILEANYSIKEAKRIKGALVKILSIDNNLVRAWDYKTKEILSFDENLMEGCLACGDKIVTLIEVVLYG